MWYISYHITYDIHDIIRSQIYDIKICCIFICCENMRYDTEIWYLIRVTCLLCYHMFIIMWPSESWLTRGRRGAAVAPPLAAVASVCAALLPALCLRSSSDSIRTQTISRLSSPFAGFCVAAPVLVPSVGCSVRRPFRSRVRARGAPFTSRRPTPAPARAEERKKNGG